MDSVPAETGAGLAHVSVDDLSNPGSGGDGGSTLNSNGTTSTISRTRNGAHSACPDRVLSSSHHTMTQQFEWPSWPKQPRY